MSDVNNLKADAEVAKLVAEAAAKATAEAQSRSLAILNCEDAKFLPTLANALAFKTSLPTAEAEMLLAAAAKDTPKLVVTDEKSSADPAQAFADRKTAAGALVGAPDAKDGPSAAAEAEAAAGWAKARARHGIK